MNNFLSIVWYKILPPLYGGQKGIASFNHYLGKKVPLTCLFSRNNAPGENLSYKTLNNLPVSRFQFKNPFVKKRMLSLVRQQSFTHVIIEHPYHAWLGKYKKKFGFRFIVHAHNIEHIRMKVRGKYWWRLVKGTEQKAFERADHILFKTEADKTTAINLFNLSPQKCLIVPYGTEETQQPASDSEKKERLRKKYNITPDEKLILFAGTLDYEPNARAIETILHHIIPLLEKNKFRFRVIICGALPEERLAELNSIPGITAPGFVSSIRDYIVSADVFINPVINGSGTQTKNIEAIAGGCNVVATTFAATGLPAYLLNKKVFVSGDGDWEQFTGNIITASLRSATVPLQFYEDHNWQSIIDRFLDSVKKDTRV
jgi:glycosyltransferase involved in cell wall biosynthesis